jgi:hypothetical protein
VARLACSSVKTAGNGEIRDLVLRRESPDFRSSPIPPPASEAPSQAGCGTLLQHNQSKTAVARMIHDLQEVINTVAAQETR